ncbi:DUF262 domain-containing protein [Microcoleus asticus]|uniref:GmrSD restriction endonucleases N-terminal domain-containing protein n=1 Tax=Microcoleus asticus IPMA8 TaxID=2563858 RepID=A0ABX2CY29_9CYAN|nr:DUF262 domain-containing protein [Microcoleus asticus]NQE35093.1 hypothetical protein [Microcoleus asticus IPMA8]
MNRVSIKGEEHPIRKIFSDDFMFTIPLYQRPYAWTNEQAGELLEDLLTSLGDGNDTIDQLNPYFLGSIVLIKSGPPEAEIVGVAESRYECPRNGNIVKFQVMY